MNRKARQRLKLREKWDKNSNCFYCGNQTIWIDRANKGKIKKPEPNEAVLKHLIDRYDNRRTARLQEQRLVVCCLKCAEEQSTKRQFELNKDVLRERSGRWPGPVR
jgi:hypothetical protein